MIMPYSCPTTRLIIILSLVSCCLSGCAAIDQMVDPSAAREKREAAMQKGAASPAVQREAQMATVTSINNRIYAHEKKVESWKKVEEKLASASLTPEKSSKMHECTMQLQDILNGYYALRQRLLQGSGAEIDPVSPSNALLQLNQQDMDYLEGGCGRLLNELQAMPAPAAQAVPTPMGPLSDPQIKQAFDSGEYDRVISLYGQLPVQPGQYPAQETTYQYARALTKNHQEAMALGVLKELLERQRQIGQRAMEPQLLRALGDLELGMGASEDARRHFEELARLPGGAELNDGWVNQQLTALKPGSLSANELKDYGVLVKNYLAYVPKRDSYAIAEQAELFLKNYPQSVAATNVGTIAKTTRAQADAVLNAEVQRVEAQASERKAHEALPSPAAPVEGAAVPPTSIEPAQPPVTAPVPGNDGHDKALQETYDKATSLRAAKEYDNAIESLTKLLNTPFHDKARMQIDEIAKVAGQEDRQKAAELFVRAGNTKDQEGKRKLLVSARDLLQGILIKYPQSGLTEKVQRNLTAVERELKILDGAASKGASS